jgi:hypothetical protein
MEQMQEFQFAPVQQVAGHQRVPGHPVPSSPQFGYMFIRELQMNTVKQHHPNLTD